MTPVVEVVLWGRTIGAVAQEHGQVASFEYAHAFQGSGIEVSPLQMPLSDRVYRFDGLAPSFHGLPGLLSEVLPDRFGNALIDAWLTRRGRDPADFGALDRLCYIGQRAMGALTFRPVTGPAGVDAAVHVADLVDLASAVLTDREDFRTELEDDDPHAGMLDILRVGTSAGGARAKALVAWNPTTGEVRSGQLDVPGFGQWLLKFDGVRANRDRELADPMGYGAIEYAYSNMARAAGIEMTATHLLEEGGRRHFMTERFDRIDGQRVHMQSLASLAHLDFNQPGTHSYEQAFAVMRKLDLSAAEREQQFLRMVFNLVARNQDDHVKNIAFLMDKRGRWRLSPAFDVTWSYNPRGTWTSQHQMTVNGKRTGFSIQDLDAVGHHALLPRNAPKQLLERVTQAVADWPRFAVEVGVESDRVAAIASTHRLNL